MEILLQYGLLAVFIALLLTPFGLVVPEEISLMAAGALAHSGHNPYWASVIVGYLGIAFADAITWNLGRWVGLKPTGWLARLTGVKQIARIERFYRRYGVWTIVLCRQVSGLRFPAFFFAGATGIPFWRFAKFDGTAAIVTANLFVYVGYAFSKNLGVIIPWLDRFREVIIAVVVSVIVGFLIRAVILWLRPPPEPPPSP